MAKLSTSEAVFSSCCIVKPEPRVIPDKTSIASSLYSNPLTCYDCEIASKEYDSSAQWRMYCGSHDKHVYCWNDRLKLEWKTELDSEVYAIPCLCNLPIRGSDVKLKSSSSIQVEGSPTQVPCLCVCTTAGLIYILNATDGGVIGSHELPWDVFSSPVINDGCVVVGCRDDSVYCFQVCLLPKYSDEVCMSLIVLHA